MTAWLDFMLEGNRRQKMRLVFFTLYGIILLGVLADQWKLRVDLQKPVPPPPSFQKQFRPRTVSFEPLDFYLGAVSRRDLFGMASAEKTETSRAVTIDELVKDYRLKGVALFDEPEAIVEDARSGKTVFLKRGEKIAELTVKEIASDHLILAYGTQTKELKLEGGMG